MAEAFGEIRIPTETLVEMKGGKRRESPAQVLPRLHHHRDGDVRRGVAPRQEHARR